MFFEQIINKVTMNPKQLFLIDGLGAVLSAFLLGVVLVRFENFIGMPQKTLYLLAILPCIFAFYDFFCYLRVKEYRKPYLKVIAFSNLVYCFISIGFLFRHRQELTNLGWVYFLLEILIILILVVIELKTDAKARLNI